MGTGDWAVATAGRGPPPPIRSTRWWRRRDFWVHACLSLRLGWCPWLASPGAFRGGGAGRPEDGGWGHDRLACGLYWSLAPPRSAPRRSSSLPAPGTGCACSIPPPSIGMAVTYVRDCLGGSGRLCGGAVGCGARNQRRGAAAASATAAAAAAAAAAAGPGGGGCGGSGGGGRRTGTDASAAVVVWHPRALPTRTPWQGAAAEPSCRSTRHRRGTARLPRGGCRRLARAPRPTRGAACPPVRRLGGTACVRRERRQQLRMYICTVHTYKGTEAGGLCVTLHDCLCLTRAVVPASEGRPRPHWQRQWRPRRPPSVINPQGNAPTARAAATPRPAAPAPRRRRAAATSNGPRGTCGRATGAGHFAPSPAACGSRF